jgi:predicted PurR-regulated permease PerM
MKAETPGSEGVPSTKRRDETAVHVDSGELRAVILTAAAFAIFLYVTRLILLPFILAGVVAYVCTPLVDRLAARTRWPRPLFAVATFIVLVGVSALVMKVAVQRLAVEAKGVAIDLQAMLDNLTHQLMGEDSIHVFGHTLSAHDISQAALEHISDWFAQPEAVTTALGVGLAAIMGTFLTVVLLFWFLISGPRVAAGLFWIVPPYRRPLAARVWARLDPVLIRYFIGVFVIVLYATVAAYIGLGVFLDIRHAVLLATLTGILEIVPVIGPTAAAVIAGLISLRTATGIMSIFAYAMYATALRLSIDQVVGPIVLGRAAHVHPALIIFCFLAGGVLLGVPGVILAVPLALLIKSALATLYGDDAD